MTRDVQTAKPGERDAARFVLALLQDYRFATLYREILYSTIDEPNAEALVVDWLRSAGYATTPGMIQEAFGSLPKNDVRFWSGQYNLLMSDGRRSVLSIGEDVRLDGDDLAGFTYHDDTLSWPEQMGVVHAGELKFSLSSDGGQAPSPSRYCGPLVQGTLRAAMAAHAAGEAITCVGKAGVVTEHGFSSAEAIDPLTAWSGDYAVTLTASDGTQTSNLALRVDGVAATASFAGESIALDAGQWQNNNTLTWTSTTWSGAITFSQPLGKQAQSFKGKVWPTSGARPTSDNAVGTITSSGLVQLLQWQGVYTFTRTLGDGTSIAYPDFVIGSDASITIDGVRIKAPTYSPVDAVLSWQGSLGGAYQNYNGRIAFAQSNVSSSITFAGVFWLNSDPQPAANNVAGVLRPPVSGSDGQAEARTFNVLDLIAYMMAGVAAIAAVYQARRQSNFEEEQQRREEAGEAHPLIQHQDHMVNDRNHGPAIPDQPEAIQQQAIEMQAFGEARAVANFELAQRGVEASRLNSAAIQRVVDQMQQAIDQDIELRDRASSADERAEYERAVVFHSREQDEANHALDCTPPNPLATFM